MVRSVDSVDERCRFERQRRERRFTPKKEARPSQLTGVMGRPGNQSGRGRIPVLCQLSYTPKERQDSNPRRLDPEGTPACAAGRTRLSRNATTPETSP